MKTASEHGVYEADSNATLCFTYFFLKQIDTSAFNAGSAVPTLNRNHIHSFSGIK